MVDDALKKIEEQLYNSMNEKSTEKIEVKPIIKKTDKIEAKEEIKERPKEEIKVEPKEKIEDEKPKEERVEKKEENSEKKIPQEKKVIKKKTTRKQAKKMPKKKSVKKKSRKKKFEIKNYIIPIASFLVILVIALVLKFAVFNDTIVASVNGKPIYLSDIEMRHALYQGIYSKEEFLNQTITETILLQEAQKQGFSVSDEEFNEMMNIFLVSSGTTKENLDKQLKVLGSSYEEFEESSRERVNINLLLESVLVNITVTEKEMKDYYTEVKDDLPENVTYEDVEDLINQSLVLNKRDEMFGDYIEELKKDYEIVVFWEYVEEKQENIDKKIELAKCLTENNVKMYTSANCPACLTQERMFGDASEFLDVVDCDTEEGKQECADLAIKATPTWIVNNIKYAGVLSLEGLAELADCEF